MKAQPGVGYIFDSSSKGWSIDTSQQFPDRDSGTAMCPLETYNLREDAGAIKFNVYPGTINNTMVRSNDMVELNTVPAPNIEAFTSGLTSTESTNYVYIRCGNTAAAGATPASYPSVSGEGRPSVRVFDAVQSDTDTYSYILIAILKGKKTEVAGSSPTTYTYELSIQRTISCNNLWSERFKCGSSGTNYWWSAV